MQIPANRRLTMKRIGILYGQETSFAEELLQRINGKKLRDIRCDSITIDSVLQGKSDPYNVIIDRVSYDVPFFLSYLKNQALSGCAVLNNPFLESAHEWFFNMSLAYNLGVRVPRTALLPSNEEPEGIDESYLRNLKYPLDWDGIFNFVGFPAYIRPYKMRPESFNNIYKVKDRDDFFDVYNQTGRALMMLQEAIDFKDFFRAYAVGSESVHIMKYDPKKPYDLRYIIDPKPIESSLIKRMEDSVLRIDKALGLDFSSYEIAVKEGIPYLTEVGNPFPEADVSTVGVENCDWAVEEVARNVIKRAKEYKEGVNNLNWGSYFRLASRKISIAK